MMNKVGQIMLYVNNQDHARDFWVDTVGFQLIADESAGEMRWIEIAPSKNVETSIILHNKELIAKLSPGLNLDTPSLMFFTEDLDQLHRDLSAKEVSVGEIVSVPAGRVFNFADNEENYYAVMERQ